VTAAPPVCCLELGGGLGRTGIDFTGFGYTRQVSGAAIGNLV
jgi:hypothetical protein